MAGGFGGSDQHPVTIIMEAGVIWALKSLSDG